MYEPETFTHQLARDAGLTQEQAQKVLDFLQRNRDRLADVIEPPRLSDTAPDPDRLLGLF